MAPDIKATNPKDAIGSNKLPMHLWPQSATAYGVIGLLNGMLKYGRTNWREAGVRPSIYVDAAMRHITDWWEGEDFDPEDGVHNLSGFLACGAILVDALESGMLNDDRGYNPGGTWRNARAHMEPHVARLKALHAGHAPKHWTIQDMSGLVLPEPSLPTDGAGPRGAFSLSPAPAPSPLTLQVSLKQVTQQLWNLGKASLAQEVTRVLEER